MNHLSIIGMSRLLILTMSALLLLFSAQSFAHHSRFGVFDTDRTIEIEGVITKIKWSNPHVQFETEVTDSGGVTQLWMIEAASVSTLRSRGLDQGFLHIGDRIKIAGYPSITDAPEVLGMNLLLNDGTEVLLDRKATPYFVNTGNGQFLEPAFDENVVTKARATADGIFRVWSSELNDPDSFPMFKGEYPLTNEAAQIRDNWQSDSSERLNCWVKDMPFLMMTPHPIEFSKQGENILMRFEEDDAERLIYMNGGDIPEKSEASSMGLSVGSWEEKTLVVKTTNIDAEIFDYDGTPIGENIRLVERFTLSPDEQRLDYRVTFYDEETFSEPFDLTKYWTWKPERTIEKWNCE
ncbi:MAG: DUF4131 domain-containing protein [Acidiferrobacterales bacterium]|nr:DUF4131 domain-containing protein [Acidiferrobacterales bacterium]